MGLQVPSGLDPRLKKNVLYGNLRKHLGDVLRDFALQKERKIIESNLVCNHVHMLISISPKYAVSQVVAYMKGRSAIHIARKYADR